MAGGIRGTIESQLENMSPRDKKLGTGLIMFVGLAALGLMTYTLLTVRSGIEYRVAEANETLRDIQALQAEYDAANAVLQRQEANVVKSQNKLLSQYAEEKAEELGIKEGLRNAQRVEQVEENGVATTKWKVELKGRTYDEAVKFLLELENGDHPVQVETARIKQTRVKRELAVDLTIELLTFKMAES